MRGSLKEGQCGFLGCQRNHLDGLYMCQLHRTILEPIRLQIELEEDPYGTRTMGGRSVGVSRTGGPRPKPQCTTPGCSNSRTRGKMFCIECELDRDYGEFTSDLDEDFAIFWES